MIIHADTQRKWLPLYEALASEVRLSILEALADSTASIKELASRHRLSSAIMTMHIRKLEQAGLVQSRMVRKDGGTHKMCSLSASGIEVRLPSGERPERRSHEMSIPVGHYSEFEVHPTCGLATLEKVVGQFDDPRYFLEPDRMFARILWFGRGFIEYRIPNYLLPGQLPEEIEISAELGSEAPGANDNWPSDIHFYLNDVCIGMWTCPGDFGSSRGRFTPQWWNVGLNQYGLLKVLKLRKDGTYLDGQKLSETGLRDLELDRNQWALRFAVQASSEHVGGLTLYGEGFGNYNQDIRFRVFY